MPYFEGYSLGDYYAFSPDVGPAIRKEMERLIGVGLARLNDAKDKREKAETAARSDAMRRAEDALLAAQESKP